MALTKYHAFGLHIADTLIKLVELVPLGQSFTPVAFGELALPPGIVVDGIISDSETLAGFINQLRQRLAWGKLTTDFVVCSLPESRVFLKAITVPHFPPKQLDEAIAWEARSLIPLPVEQAYFNTQIIERREKNVDVLIAATERKIVDTYLSTLTIAKLTPIAFDLECDAAARTINEQEIKKSVVLVIHIGIKSTALSIFRYAKLLFSNTIPHGLWQLTEDLATSRNIAWEKALEEINQSGVTNLAAERTLTAIANGIISTISFYNGQVKNPQERIQKLLATGSSVDIRGLIPRLKSLISVYELTIAKPRVVIAEDHQNKGCKPLAASIGLALRGGYPSQFELDINFLPESFIRGVETREIQKKSVRLLAIFTYIVFLMLAVLAFGLWSITNELESLKDENKHLEAESSEHPARKQYAFIEETNSLMTILQGAENSRLPIQEILETVNEAVPRNVSFKSLTLDRIGESIEIKGKGARREDILIFVTKLQEQKMFKNITVSLSSFDQESEGSFSLTMTFAKTIK